MENLSVVIPLFNEEDNIIQLVTDIIQSLSSTIRQLEILLIDDCSTDNTETVCKNLPDSLADILSKYQKNSTIFISHIRHMKNSGQSAAVYTGVKHARFPIIATLDGDGQNPPREIKNLINAHRAYLAENPSAQPESILFAGHRQNRQDSWIKLISSKIANKIRKALLKDNCPDSGCGLKLFYQAIFLSLPHFNHMHRFLPALYKRQQLIVINVPINHQPRKFGLSKYNTWGRLKVGVIDLLGVAWLARRPCHPKILKSNKIVNSTVDLTVHSNTSSHETPNNQHITSQQADSMENQTS